MLQICGSPEEEDELEEDELDEELLDDELDELDDVEVVGEQFNLTASIPTHPVEYAFIFTFLTGTEVSGNETKSSLFAHVLVSVTLIIGKIVFPPESLSSNEVTNPV